MMELIQENTGMVLQVKIFSTYDTDVAEEKVNIFLRMYKGFIHKIESCGTHYGRIIIYYYSKLVDIS